MVNIDIGLKELIGLYSIEKIKKDELKKHLDKFQKEDFIDYILEEEDYDNVEDTTNEDDML